jgi:phage tail-like protein
MTLAAQRPVFSAGRLETRASEAPIAMPVAGTVDVHALARRVYDLMQDDLRTERRRRGQWLW